MRKYRRALAVDKGAGEIIGVDATREEQGRVKVDIFGVLYCAQIELTLNFVEHFKGAWAYLLRLVCPCSRFQLERMHGQTYHRTRRQ